MTVLHTLIATLEARGARANLVGGCVRDELLGLVPNDFDIEVFNLGLADVLATLLTFGKVGINGASYQVIELRTPEGESFHISLPRRDRKVALGHGGIEATTDAGMDEKEAAARRDYTMNAISRASDGYVHDPYDGRQDLRQRILRHVSPAFAEDPLRVLRGMQFAARFGLTAAPETVALCRSLRGEYHTLSASRIWGEWEKWSRSAVPSRGLAFLYRTGWLAFYPELAALVGVPQDARFHPEGSAFRHTAHVCDQAAAIARREGLDNEAYSTLVFAALCHDMGKAVTTEIHPDGHVTSRGHAEAGVALAESFMRRIGAPCRRDNPSGMVKAVMALTQEHMILNGGEPTKTTARRLLARLDADPQLLFHLIEADCSGRPPRPVGMPARGERLRQLVNEIGATVPPLLRGRDLLGCGWTGGPHMGRVLRIVYERQLDGHITNLAEALEAAHALAAAA